MRGPVHKCAVIFVDNSGIDIIMGVFPFARELLNRGTRVSGLSLTLTLKLHRHDIGVTLAIREILTSLYCLPQLEK